MFFSAVIDTINVLWFDKYAVERKQVWNCQDWIQHNCQTTHVFGLLEAMSIFSCSPLFPEKSRSAASRSFQIETKCKRLQIIRVLAWGIYQWISTNKKHRQGLILLTKQIPRILNNKLRHTDNETRRARGVEYTFCGNIGLEILIRSTPCSPSTAITHDTSTQKQNSYSIPLFSPHK